MKSIYFITLLWMLSVLEVSGQAGNDSVKIWIECLSDPNDFENKALQSLTMMAFNTVILNDPGGHGIYPEGYLKIRKLAGEIEKSADSKDLYFKSRLNCLKSRLLYRENYIDPNTPSRKKDIIRLMDEAIHCAYEMNDDYLLAYIGQLYFGLMKYYDELPLAVMYGVYSTELYEKRFGVSRYPAYNYLAELMFTIREYDKCIEYAKKWLELGNVGRDSYDKMNMFNLNTLALAYHRQTKYDSALFFYNKALLVQQNIHVKDWEGVIKGNKGQIYYHLKQYDTALSLLERDYVLSLEYKYYENAANSLQWMARTNDAMGNYQKAIAQVREALSLIKITPSEGYQQNIYFAAIDIYRSNKLYDSALYYARLYQQLHDKIEKKINLSSIDITKVRMKEVEHLSNMRKLQLEKKNQLQHRNFAILGIAILALIIILFINRQRSKSKQKQQLLHQEKKLIEQEIASASRQMEMFTQNIQEKTDLIEKLEMDMLQKQSSASQQEMINNISQLTILTEADWDKFKQLFEKIYPMFFEKLKAIASDITWAEQRMAALTRLHLTARQMASMQGISVDSVHKTRQRLRQRLQITNAVNLEEFFSSF